MVPVIVSSSGGTVWVWIMGRTITVVSARSKICACKVEVGLVEARGDAEGDGFGALSGEVKGVGCVVGGGRSSESRASAGSVAPREEKGSGMGMVHAETQRRGGGGCWGGEEGVEGRGVRRGRREKF